MKTKLLKELRNEAYRAYGIKNKLAIPNVDVPSDKKWDGVYIIGLRNMPDKDVVEFRLKDAKKRLHRLRIEYCISMVKEKRVVNNKIRFCRF